MHPQKNNNNNTNKQTNKQPLSFSVQLQAYHLLSSVTLPHPVTLSFEIIHRHTPSNALSLSVESYTPLPPLPPLSLLLLLSHPFSFSLSLCLSLSLCSFTTTLFLDAWNNSLHIDWFSGLPMMHGLRVFDTLEPKLNPFKFVLFVELTF